MPGRWKRGNYNRLKKGVQFSVMTWLRKLFFNLQYLGSPPWDTGITPPELRAFIAQHPAGRALDLGCGTGTNVLALARAGWEATGVDFSGKAIRMARRKARQAGLPVHFLREDVVRLQGIHGPFDLILDIGCFHSLPPAHHQGYAQKIAELLAPEGTYLLYAFFREPASTQPGITQPELDAAFSRLHLFRRQDGSERGRRPSAWLWYRNEAVG